MPELPEVEIVKQSLNKIVKFKTISKVIVNNRNLRFKIPKNFEKSLKKKKITKIFRKSKYVIFQINFEQYLIMHLGMSGTIHMSDKGNKKNISPNFVPWFSKKNHITKDLDFLVFGHWAALQGKTNLSNFQALDTGCCWGKELTFLRLEDQKRFIIKSKQK